MGNSIAQYGGCKMEGAPDIAPSDTAADEMSLSTNFRIVKSPYNSRRNEFLADIEYFRDISA